MFRLSVIFTWCAVGVVSNDVRNVVTLSRLGDICQNRNAPAFYGWLWMAVTWLTMHAWIRRLGMNIVDSLLCNNTDAAMISRGWYIGIDSWDPSWGLSRAWELLTSQTSHLAA